MTHTINPTQSCCGGNSKLDLTDHIGALLDYERTNGLAAVSLKNLNSYLVQFNNYLAEHPVCCLNQVSTDLLRDYIIQRTDGRSDSLKKAVIWSIQSLFGYLTLRGEISSNPGSAIKYPKERKQEKLPVYLSSKQLRQILLWSAEHSRPADFAIINLMASTGMRPGDLTSLTRFDYDAAQKVIYPKVKGSWVKPTPLSNSAAEVLDFYLSTRADSDTALFLNKHNKPVQKSYIQRLIKQAGSDAGLEIPLTCNIVRHTFATHACDRHGKHMTQVLMGHSRSKTTDVYAHLSPRHFKALMNEHPYNQITGAQK